jgi:uncharacterized protein (TIGR02270 family)
MPQADHIPHAAESILWDVVEEHFDELEFCIDMFDRQLDDVDLSLRGLSSVEARLGAHLDGLVVAGDAVVERLLAPAAVEADPGEPARTTAVALGLVALHRHKELLSLLFHEQQRVREPAIRACQLMPTAALESWARQSLSSTRDGVQRAALIDVLSRRGVETTVLVESLRAADPVLVAAASRAALWGDATACLPWLENALRSSDAGVREAALVPALALGSSSAWGVCQELALDSRQPQPAAMALVASLGNKGHRERLVPLLARESHRKAALFALGFSGDPDYAPVLIGHISGADPLEAKIAAQSLSIIAGLNLGDEALAVQKPPATSPRENEPESPSPEEEVSPEDESALENEPEDLVPQPEDALPELNADAIERLWRQMAPRFDPRERYLGGRVFDADVAIDYLERAPLRRRHVLGHAIAVRSAARARIDTRGLRRSQLAELATIRLQDRATLFRQFVGW